MSYENIAKATRSCFIFAICKYYLKHNNVYKARKPRDGQLWRRLGVVTMKIVSNYIKFCSEFERRKNSRSSRYVDPRTFHAILKGSNH